MKPLLILTAFLLIPSGAIAQEPPSDSSRHRVAPQPPTRPVLPPTTRTVKKPGATPQAANPGSLSENVILHWLGSFQGIADLDFQLVGCGPEFRSEFTMTDSAEADLPPSIFSIHAMVNRAGERYHVQYSIGARIPVKTGGTSMPGKGPVSHHIEFRDIMTSGAVLVKLGEPLVIRKADGKALTFSVSAVK